VNSHGIQQNILVTQGFVTTLIALLYAFIPDVSSAYWIFSVMTTQVYLVMYVLMFFAAMQLRRRQGEHPRGFKAPALSLLCIVGIIASIAAFLIGFVPPSQFENGDTATYVAIVGGGVLIIGFIVPGVSYGLRKPNWKTALAEEVEEVGIPEVAPAPAEMGAAPPARALPAQGGAGEEEEEVALPAGAEALPGPESPRYDPERQPTVDHPTRRKLIYGAIGVVLGVALVYGLVVLPDRRKDEEAQAKADQTIAAFEAQGLTPPSKDLLVNLLGTDGGNACENPGSALNEALHRISLSNGAAQVGMRPVTVDSDVVQGGLIILDTYCPDKAQEVRDYLDDLEYDDVVHQ
jgi:hypothetical protein